MSTARAASRRLFVALSSLETRTILGVSNLSSFSSSPIAAFNSNGSSGSSSSGTSGRATMSPHSASFPEDADWRPRSSGSSDDRAAAAAVAPPAPGTTTTSTAFRSIALQVARHGFSLTHVAGGAASPLLPPTGRAFGSSAAARHDDDDHPRHRHHQQQQHAEEERQRQGPPPALAGRPLPRRVTLVEVGPRDGLQNEPGVIPTPTKIRFIELLADAGLSAIEATSFVSPKWVPQLADAEEVVRAVRRSRPRARYTALTPNLKGFERAVAAGADEVAIFGAASEAFSRKNINCGIAESLDRFRAVTDAARALGVPVRGYVSCAVHCPYSGDVPPRDAAAVAKALLDMGCYEISLGDTTGRGTPEQFAACVRATVAAGVPVSRVAAHLHDTYGQGLANALAALLEGVSVFDASAGGLGGCPYSPGASGNVATEDLAYMLTGLGVAHGVDLPRLVGASAFISRALGREPSSHVARAMAAAAGGGAASEGGEAAGGAAAPPPLVGRQQQQHPQKIARDCGAEARAERGRGVEADEAARRAEPEGAVRA